MDTHPDDRHARDVIAQNIARIRAERGWSQATLAEAMTKAGSTWHPTTVARAENGQRNFDLDDIDALLGVMPTAVEGTYIGALLGSTRMHAFDDLRNLDQAIQSGRTAIEALLAAQETMLLMQRRWIERIDTNTPDADEDARDDG